MPNRPEDEPQKNKRPIVASGAGGVVIGVGVGATCCLGASLLPPISDAIRAVSGELSLPIDSETQEEARAVTLTPTQFVLPTYDLIVTPSGTPPAEAGVVPTNTFTPEPIATRVVENIPGFRIERLGPGPIIPDSVWPGGINETAGAFTENEVLRVADIYNGTTALTVNPLNLAKLSNARAYAESIFGLTGRIDISTLNPNQQAGRYYLTFGRRTFESTSNISWFATGSNQMYVIHEVYAPEGYTYNQIAARDSDQTAYVNNGTTISGEVLYIVQVYNMDGEVINVLTFRGACGNIGREGEDLPEPTPGATPTFVATYTPTSPGRNTPTHPAGTPTLPPTSTAAPTNQHTIATATPGVPPVDEPTATDIP